MALAYDRMPGGKPRANVSPKRLGTKKRIDALIRLKQGKNWFWDLSQTVTCFVFTAGFSKESPTKPTEQVPQSLAEQMRLYTQSMVQGRTDVQISSTAWGTYAEIRDLIRMCRGFYPGENHTIFISTNLGHMPRTLLCWFFLEKPASWRVRPVLADHSFTPKEWVQETAKFFTYLYRFSFKKW